MICPGAFWKQKCKNLKNISPTFFKFQSTPDLLCLWPEALINRQFYCTGVIVYNKLDKYSVVSAYKQTFLGLEMTANLCDTSTLMCKINKIKDVG